MQNIRDFIKISPEVQEAIDNNNKLTIQINNNIKTIIYYQQVEFISGMQDFSTFENQSI